MCVLEEHLEILLGAAHLLVSPHCIRCRSVSHTVVDDCHSVAVLVLSNCHSTAVLVLSNPHFLWVLEHKRVT